MSSIHHSSGKADRPEKIRGPVITSLLVLVLAVSPGLAGFSRQNLSGPAQGMAGCFTAKADHVSALMINPAGLAQLQRAEVSFLHSEPLVSLPGIAVRQDVLAAALPVSRRWTIGLGATSFNAGDLIKEQETTLGLIRQAAPNFFIGANVSYLRHSYNTSADARVQSDPLFRHGRAKGAFGLDVGMLYRPLSLLSVGASVRRLNRPDLGLASADRVPLEARAGLQVRLGHFSLLADALRRDAGRNVASSSRTTFATGMEWTPFSKLALRLGAGQKQLSSGLGLTIGSMTLDYAFGLLKSSAGQADIGHQISLTARFGKNR